MIKKTVGLILIFLLAFNTMAVMASKLETMPYSIKEEAINRIVNLGIMQGYPDGSFKGETNVTRAEFTTVVINMLGLNGAGFTNSGFTDVPDDHWAASQIRFASDLGLINGIGNGLFAPDATVTDEQAIKIVVEALGYGVAAQKAGGYPGGYIAVASSRDILKKSAIPTGKEMTREEVAVLINDAIDVPILEEVIGAGGQYEIKDGNTIYEETMFRRDLINVSGIVTATDKTAINGDSYFKKGYVEIDGNIYNVGESNVCDYLGYYVNAYLTDKNADNPNTVVSVDLFHNKNSILNIKAADLSNKTNLSTVSYYVNGKKATEDISGATFIYNGKYVKRSDLTNSDILINDGNLFLLDNNGDSRIDVVFITERESFIVRRTSTNSKGIYFKSGNVYRGGEGIKINDEDDENKEYYIYDTNGNEINFSEIKEGSVISLEISLDGNYGKVYVSNDTVSGKITAVDTNENLVYIDDEEYRLGKTSAGDLKYIADLGVEATLLLDYDKNIVGDDGNKGLKYKYAYVTKIGHGLGIEENLKIKVVLSGKKEKIVEVVNDTENVSYSFKNDSIAVLETTDSVKFAVDNGDYVKKNSNEIGSEIVNRVIQYTTNRDGKIDKLRYFTDTRTDRYFNAKIMSFGGTFDGEAYVANDSTQFIMVPTGYADAIDDDYLVDVEVADKSKVSMIPVAIDDETQVAESILIFANMDSKTPKPFKENVGFSIVGKIGWKSTSDGDGAYNLKVLTGDKLNEISISKSNSRADIVGNLIEGDLIRYNLDSSGEIDNIEKRATVQGLENEFFRANANGPSETVYGLASDVVLHRLVNFYNEYMDVVTIDYGSGTATYNIPCENGPEIYMYDRSTGDISIGVVEDIITSEYAGSDATKVFMLVDRNEPIAVVLITD